jgi:hypothetical protein
MTEPELTSTQTFSRPAKLSDFVDGPNDIPSKNKYNKNYSQNDSIDKNQQEFGQRKRIKP